MESRGHPNHRLTPNSGAVYPLCCPMFGVLETWLSFEGHLPREAKLPDRPPGSSILQVQLGKLRQPPLTLAPFLRQQHTPKVNGYLGRCIFHTPYFGPVFIMDIPLLFQIFAPSAPFALSLVSDRPPSMLYPHMRSGRATPLGQSAGEH